MLNRADEILKLALAAAALLIAGSIGYYYAVFLPGQAIESAKQIADTERAKREQTDKIEAKKSADAANAKNEYELCLGNAQANYDSRWQNSCKSIHDRAQKSKADCLAQYGPYSYCSGIEVPPARDCSLPNQVSQNYDHGLENDKRLCFEKMAVATGQSKLAGPELDPTSNSR